MEGASGPDQPPEGTMSDHVYKKIELTGTSMTTIEDAIRNAIARASKTLRNIQWFELVDLRGQVSDGQVGHWQVTIKAGFTLDD
jgi:flavin-binding protein dodecin